MAVEIKHAFDMTRSSVYLMNPLDVFIDPLLDVRHVPKPVTEDLVPDILSKPDGRTIKGQLVPVTCRKNSKGYFTIIMGRRRKEAIEYINDNHLTPEPMMLKVVYLQANDVEALAMALSENVQRADMGVYDYAYSVKQFERFGKDETWIALNSGLFPNLAKRIDGNFKHPELKKAIRQLRAWKRLLDLAPEVEKGVVEGRVTETQAQRLAKMETEQQVKIMKATEGEALKSSDIPKAASDKPKKPTMKQVKEELDGIIMEWAAKLPSEVNDLLTALRDRI